MKQHSYAFYNGHLSELYKTRETLRKALKELQDKVPAAGTSETRPLARSLTTGHLDQKPNLPGWHQERKTSAKESEEIRQAIISGEPLDLDQILLFERMLKWEIDAISSELQGKSTTYNGTYPHNLTLKNHYEYTLLPTLVYELEYPRTDHINWLYVLEKAVATCGVLFVMQLVSQTYVYPVVVRTVQWRKAGVPVSERLDRFPSIISDLIFPFMIEYMMTWYVIFESVLNLLAELTYFADRGFYGDWWNSVSWDQYARDWNKPVHVFLLRHVYHSSISTLLVSKHVATLITFTLSALVHELLMFCLFKRVRGYLLILQMCQLPLVWLSRTKWLRDKKTLGNLVFWLGLFTGPSLLCSLYLII